MCRVGQVVESCEDASKVWAEDFSSPVRRVMGAHFLGEMVLDHMIIITVNNRPNTIRSAF